jgi:hypothetical protein
MKSVDTIIRYLNRNVYLTNILLIPSAITSFVIYEDSRKMKGDTIGEEIYTYFWLFLSLYTLLVIGASNFHHLFMFSDVRLQLPKAYRLDTVTAPIFGLIMGALSIFYGKFLFTKCNEIDNKFPILYYTAIAFMIIGSLVFVLKRIFMKGFREKGLMYKIKYLESHTFFHYISYTGVMIMLFLFMFENKLIFKTLFTDYCKNK